VLRSMLRDRSIPQISHPAKASRVDRFPVLDVDIESTVLRTHTGQSRQPVERLLVAGRWVVIAANDRSIVRLGLPIEVRADLTHGGSSWANAVPVDVRRNEAAHLVELPRRIVGLFHLEVGGPGAGIETRAKRGFDELPSDPPPARVLPDVQAEEADAASGAKAEIEPRKAFSVHRKQWYRFSSCPPDDSPSQAHCGWIQEFELFVGIEPRPAGDGLDVGCRSFRSWQQSSSEIPAQDPRPVDRGESPFFERAVEFRRVAFGGHAEDRREPTLYIDPLATLDRSVQTDLRMGQGIDCIGSLGVPSGEPQQPAADVCLLQRRPGKKTPRVELLRTCHRLPHFLELIKR